MIMRASWRTRSRGRRGVDALDRFGERGVELTVALVDAQTLAEGPGEAGDDAVVASELGVGLVTCVTARQRHDAKDLGMADELGVEVVDVGQRYLEYDVLVRAELTEALHQCGSEERLGVRLLRAVDVDFGLEDGNESGAQDLEAELELLVHDRLDATSVGLLDERSHLGAEDAVVVGLAEDAGELGDGL